MTVRVHHDAETRGVVLLDKEGADAYFDDPRTDVLMLSFGIEIDGEFPVGGITSVSRFWPTRQTELTCPPALRTCVEAGDLLYAHNASFERKLWDKILVPRYGWPQPHREQFVCTMAMCAAMGMPLALDSVAQALGFEHQKDPGDHRNMMAMCKPRKARKGEDPDATYWFDEPHRWPKLQARCERDVWQEHEICQHVRHLTPRQREFYWMSEEINDRGMHVDQGLADTAAAMIRQITSQLNEEIRQVSLGNVKAVTNVQDVIRYLASFGIDMPDCTADTMATVLAQRLPEDDGEKRPRRVLELRQSGSKISTRKINGFRTAVEKDGRIRGWAQYHGAMPGRYTARRVQNHNIKRPTIGKKMVPIAIETVKMGDLDWCQRMFGDPMETISNILRGCIVAAPGTRLISSDYSNIQGRLCAWYSGQQDKLDAFAAHDAGTGHDLYNIAYGQVFDIPPGDVDSRQRAVGKVIELSLGFEGGPAAFDQMAKGYGVDVEQQFEHIAMHLGPLEGLNGRYSMYEECERGWKSYGFKTNLSPKKWFAADLIKRSWRQKNDRIASAWHDLKQAAINAVYDPANTYRCCGGKIAYRMHGEHLACQLPSSDVIWYLFPELRSVDMPWATEEKPATDVALTYMRKDPTTSQWRRIGTHGGKQMENICLGGEAALLQEAMFRCKHARSLGYSTDYPIVLHVHDEAVAELPHGVGSLAEMNAILMAVRPWVAGCPIKSEGWEGHEYRKG